MDGGLGHGHRTIYGTKDIEGKKRDKIKDKLAKENNISLTRIDCLKSDLSYIKKNIELSVLSKMFDLSVIDWDNIEKECSKNIHKLICSDYELNSLSLNDLSKKYSYTVATLRKILKKGSKFGWCNYQGIQLERTNDGYINITAKKIREKRKAQILKYCLTHDYYSGPIIQKDLGINSSYVISILHELSNDGLIDYNSNFALTKKPTLQPIPKKKVGVFNNCGKLIKTYNSIRECEECSECDFGTKFFGSQISAVCLGKRYLYKGYHFKHI